MGDVTTGNYCDVCGNSDEQLRSPVEVCRDCLDVERHVVELLRSDLARVTAERDAAKWERDKATRQRDAAMFGLLADTVHVEFVGSYYARLMVNGYGVASWDREAEVRNTHATGEEYANECARVLRKAIQDFDAASSGSNEKEKGQGDG